MSSRIRNIEFVLMINSAVWMVITVWSNEGQQQVIPIGAEDLDFVVQRVSYDKTTITCDGKVLWFLQMFVVDDFNELTFLTQKMKLVFVPIK